MLFDILKKVFNGIKNIFRSRILLIGFGIVFALTVVAYFTMTPGVGKAVVIFLSLPTYLFFVGEFKPKQNQVTSCTDDNYDNYSIYEDETPIVDRVERSTTTTTKETIYFKKGVRYLE